MDKSKLTALEAKIKEYFTNGERLIKKYNFPSYKMHKIAMEKFGNIRQSD